MTIKQIGKDAYMELKQKIFPQVKIETKHLKSKEIPGMVIFNEHMRRFQEMNSMMNQEMDGFLKNHTFAINVENPTVKKIMKLKDEKKYNKAELLIKYVHKLALLEQKPLNGKELHDFVSKTNKILQMI